MQSAHLFQTYVNYHWKYQLNSGLDSAVPRDLHLNVDFYSGQSMRQSSLDAWLFPMEIKQYRLPFSGNYPS